MHTILKNVKPSDGFLLELTFLNGSSAIINLEKRVHTLRFSPLADRKLFATARPIGDRIVWSDGKQSVSYYCSELLETMLMD